MNIRNLEKPDSVFVRVPEIEDICIEFGIDRNDAETITYMYEVYKRCNGTDKVLWEEEAYDEGYKDGYDAAIDDACSKVSSIEWDIERLKKS